MSQDTILPSYFPAVARNYKQPLYNLVKKVDAINPPAGFPWHRWGSNGVNIEKFVHILELSGSGQDPTEGTGFPPVNLPLPPNQPRLNRLHSPVIVRNGKVYHQSPNVKGQVKHKTSENMSQWFHFEGFRGRGWVSLLVDAVALAKHLEPQNRRFRTLTNGDFPFLWDSYDYPYCGDDGVPIFRYNLFSDASECNYAFPMITHHYWEQQYWYPHTYPTEAANTEKVVPNDWDREFDRYESRYPWESKIRKAVWRGSATGHFLNLHWRPRVKMVKAAMGHPDTMDIAFSSDEGYSVSGPRVPEHLIREPIKQEDFMKYRAIVDIDGNGWSSRFGELTCYNSVVIKVRGEYQAYFEKELRPWEHYIPMKPDFSDLELAVEFALSPENEDKVKAIIENSRQFCRFKFIHHVMVTDFMWTLLAYAELLDATEGFHEAWKANKIAYNLPAHDMTSLPY
eukprot:CAMPEP_0195508116 /NCGR_PEP_ID=MMETSP0794_2-20130614/1411_1 /TAXON_ID=515487 /ORGANISM="Stephanopyxis turris, Strain CCMP 815" /LENGTH=452 /DNA_ID=CAMNT_0040634995 /DNA_START=340 /DNA_END=1701 /DNA_ORIENTATION=+